MSAGGLVLRDARPTDAGAVGAILTAFTERTPWMPRLRSAAEDIACAGEMIDRGWVRVAEIGPAAGGRVAGFIARDGAAIHALYVAPDARRRGIGTALLAEAQAAADALELETFEANAAARAFYAAQGFAETGRSAGAGNDEGLPDVRWRWQAPQRRRA